MTTWKWLRKINLRSERFLVVSEQRKTAERNLVPRTIFPGFGEGNEVARNHGWGTGFSVARCLPLVPCCLLRNYTETLARQATERPTFSNNSWKNHLDKQQRGKAGSCWRSGTAGKITLEIEGKADRTAMGWYFTNLSALFSISSRRFSAWARYISALSDLVIVFISAVRP